MNVSEFLAKTAAVKNNIQEVIVGKHDTIELLLTAIFAGGHVLLEDVPGTGKTMLAKALAKTFDCEMKRVQFTADLLPSDLSGVNVYRPQTGDFHLRKGPVFTHILLADEINRATPRTQSSLLEAMEEHRVTIDGETHHLMAPFFVIATQNPLESQGTFPLPEAQLDRFMIRIGMGLPTLEEEKAILYRFNGEDPLANLGAVLQGSEIAELQGQLHTVHMEEEVVDYMLRLAAGSREHADIAGGASPRATQHLFRACQSRALIQGRDYVLPDDVKALIKPVFAHRLVLRNAWTGEAGEASRVLDELLEKTPAPTETVSGI